MFAVMNHDKLDRCRPGQQYHAVQLAHRNGWGVQVHDIDAEDLPDGWLSGLAIYLARGSSVGTLSVVTCNGVRAESGRPACMTLPRSGPNGHEVGFSVSLMVDDRPVAVRHWRSVKHLMRVISDADWIEGLMTNGEGVPELSKIGKVLEVRAGGG